MQLLTVRTSQIFHLRYSWGRWPLARRCLRWNILHSGEKVHRNHYKDLGFKVASLDCEDCNWPHGPDECHKCHEQSKAIGVISSSVESSPYHLGRFEFGKPFLFSIRSCRDENNHYNQCYHVQCRPHRVEVCDPPSWHTANNSVDKQNDHRY